MAKPVYKNENTLFIIAAIISAICWAVILYATSGVFLLFIPVFYILLIFAESALISYLKGTGALVSSEQFPDLHKMVVYCAEKLSFKKIPQVYILNGNGVLNAFATQFLFKNYIVLLSDVIDSFEGQSDPIHFYIGHEMGHIDRKHIAWAPFLSFGMILPLIGAGYSRAREYTCDLYGAECCTPDMAQRALAALAVGKKRHQSINLQAYMEQAKATSGFWMSFHELVASYPWLVKRIAKLPSANPVAVPLRNPFAYLFAIFVPRLTMMSVIFIYLVAISVGGGLVGKDLVSAAKARRDAAHPMSNEYQQQEYAPQDYDTPQDNAQPPER